MPLEAGTFISDLVVTNPVGATDERRFGDDHLRLIKTVLKNTFPDGSRAFRFPRVGSAPAAYNIVAADEGTLFFVDPTGGIYNLTLPALGAIYPGWFVRVKSVGTPGANGNYVVMLPAGAEQIEQRASWRVYPRDDLTFLNTGAAWVVLGVRDRVLIQEIYQNPGAEWKFRNIGPDALQFKSFEIEWDGMFPAVSGGNMVLVASADNGTTAIPTMHFVYQIAQSGSSGGSSGSTPAGAGAVLWPDQSDGFSFVAAGHLHYWPSTTTPFGGSIRWDGGYFRATSHEAVVAQGWIRGLSGANCLIFSYSSGLGSGGMRCYGVS